VIGRRMRKPSAPVWARGAVAAVLATLLAVPSAALAEPAAEQAAKEPAVISLGDSFISGEAGRWQGNGNTVWGSRYGTDLAAYGCTSSETVCLYDATKAYGSSYYNGCNRSVGAEIHHLSTVRVDGRTFEIDAGNRINLACSGATTDNVLRTPFKGERPQIEQLAEHAAAKDVKLIVLSIGGNDIGFSDVITDCVKGFSRPKALGWHCSDKLGSQMPGRIDAMRAKVVEVLEAVQDTMSDAGYDESDYRLVLQTYPSPIPRGADNRYPETSNARIYTGGCPFYDDDSDWARDTLIPALAASHEQAAASVGGVHFLDLQDALDGHEVCAEGVRQSVSGNTLVNPLPKAESEWARFIVSGLAQGQQQESMHPNFYGQQRLGECLSAMAVTAAHAHTCPSPS
jgi:hypothetical protein